MGCMGPGPLVAAGDAPGDRRLGACADRGRSRGADVLIRDATAGDLPAISDLSNAMVTTSTIAWTETPETLAQRQAWFEHQQADGNPVLVADVDGTVVGYATYADFRDSQKWPGYRFTIEHTIHVREDHWGRDIGRALLDALIERGATRASTSSSPPSTAPTSARSGSTSASASSRWRGCRRPATSSGPGWSWCCCSGSSTPAAVADPTRPGRIGTRVRPRRAPTPPVEPGLRVGLRASHRSRCCPPSRRRRSTVTATWCLPDVFDAATLAEVIAEIDPLRGRGARPACASATASASPSPRPARSPSPPTWWRVRSGCARFSTHPFFVGVCADLIGPDVDSTGTRASTRSPRSPARSPGTRTTATPSSSRSST